MTTETIAKQLGLSKSTLRVDVKSLAWEWQELVFSLDYCSGKLAIFMLFSLVKAYMRGRGFKMGNYQGYLRHHEKSTFLVTEVIDVVLKGGAVYESLQKFGFTSAADILSRMRESYPMARGEL